MKLFWKITSALSALIFIAGCSSPMSEFQGPNWKQEHPRGSLKYYSPSMIEVMGDLDTTGMLSSSFEGVHDVCMYTLDSNMVDSSYAGVASGIMEEIDALEMESILAMSMGNSFKVVGETVDGDTKYVLIAIHQDPAITVIEIRGNNLKSTLTKAIMSAFQGNNQSSIPFLP